MWTVKWCAGKSCELCIQRIITWKEQADGWTDSVGDVEQNRITVFNAPGQNTESLTETDRVQERCAFERQMLTLNIACINKLTTPTMLHVMLLSLVFPVFVLVVLFHSFRSTSLPTILQYLITSDSNQLCLQHTRSNLSSQSFG